MSATTSIEMVDGKLTPDNGGNWIPVRLRLKARTLWEGSTPADVMVADCDLMPGKAPDGEYWLEYSYLKQYRQKVRVQAGKFVRSVVAR